MATLFGCFNRRVSAVGWILDANGQIGVRYSLAEGFDR